MGVEKASGVRLLGIRRGGSRESGVRSQESGKKKKREKEGKRVKK